MIYHGQLLQDKWLDDHFRRRGITHGTFVDIGAFDGVTFSNTKIFEDAGWDGLCIEPQSDNFEALKRNRKCKCVRAAASDKHGTGTLTFCTEESDQWHGRAVCTLGTIDPWRTEGHTVAREETKLVPVAEILADALPDATSVELLSLDTDGHDLQILRAWPWGRFKPLAIVVEYNKDRVELIEHMESAGYAVADDNGQDLFFTQPEHQ